MGLFRPSDGFSCCLEPQKGPLIWEISHLEGINVNCLFSQGAIGAKNRKNQFFQTDSKWLKICFLGVFQPSGGFLRFTWSLYGSIGAEKWAKMAKITEKKLFFSFFSFFSCFLFFSSNMAKHHFRGSYSPGLAGSSNIYIYIYLKAFRLFFLSELLAFGKKKTPDSRNLRTGHYGPV